jgi:hypothetical protein
VDAIHGQPQRGATLHDGLAALRVLTAMSMSAAADGATIRVSDAVGEP